MNPYELMRAIDYEARFQLFNSWMEHEMMRTLSRRQWLWEYEVGLEQQ